MSKVVYLLGGGASYGKRHEISFRGIGGRPPKSSSGRYAIDEGLPVVNEINTEISNLIEDIKQSDENYKDPKDNVGQLIKDLVWLRDESSRHMTVDTFAKKLFLQNDSLAFEKLKKTLSSFFILEQLKYPADKRYDAFLANILSYPGKKIPNDITILTWNYDSQFEIAYREFNSTNQPSASYWKGVRKQLGIKDSHDTEFENGKIFKLNGTAIFDYFHSFSLLGESCVDDFKNTIGSIADVHTQFNPNNHLYFAWESSPTSQYFKELYPHISNAETLVVIGYTFPYFNRVIDRSIFETMGSLKKIYIQDPFAERIHQNINPVLSISHTSISKVQVYELKDVDQFYLPAEL